MIAFCIQTDLILELVSRNTPDDGWNPVRNINMKKKTTKTFEDGLTLPSTTVYGHKGAGSN